MTAPCVILVTDPRWPLARIESVVEAAGEALAPSSLGVQLRDKSASRAELARSAKRLRSSTARAGALFIVNTPSREALQVAVDAGADGVHVPCRLETVAEARELAGERAWVSVPAHTDGEIEIARDAGATSALVSPIFESPGKGTPRGVGAITAARDVAPRLLVFALGGVDVSRVDACARAGARGVAVIRALLDAPDPAATAAALAAPFGGRGR